MLALRAHSNISPQHFELSRTFMMFNFRALFTSALLLAPAIHGCVIYSAVSSANGQVLNDADLYDNGEIVCQFNGDIGSDGLYRFTCIAGNIAAIANSDGVVEYANPGGNYQFQANSYFDPDSGVIYWSACEYGCSSAVISAYCS